ncbi:MAG TPA: response regulator transcription factor, partial [Pseudolysinimonas sp.]|nr:response regulator transcription factor [Pseudolysinimonas sp.]
GFAALLNANDDIEVVGEAADGEQAVARAGELQPDVILMDVRMPRLDGIQATRQLLDAADTDARPHVLMLTTFDIDEYVFEAVRAGASGFLLKDALPEELASAVRVIARGDALLDPTMTKRMIEHFISATSAPPEPVALESLTPREREVLVLIAKGLSNQEIARDLVLAEQTVKSHVSRILRKLGLRDRAQAVVAAYESGLVTRAE